MTDGADEGGGGRMRERKRGDREGKREGRNMERGGKGSLEQELAVKNFKCDIVQQHEEG